MIQRLVYVAYYERVLVFTCSAPLERRAEAEAAFEGILATVRFRRKD
jgi:hypothetical protein